MDVRLTDEQIVQVLTDYIQDDNNKQAVILDGVWGCGKTHFIEKVFLPSLQKRQIDRRIVYVSLYGMERTEQISQALRDSFMGDLCKGTLGEEGGLRFKDGIDTILRLFSDKTTGFQEAVLPWIEKKAKQDMAVIFDDMERCDIDMNRLLGFINNLVEHDSVKVIIVTNEEEVEKRAHAQDTDKKYGVALNAWAIQNAQQRGAERSNADKALVDREALDSIVKQTFCRDDHSYKRIKEKAVGLTIRYEANLADIYDSVVCGCIKDSDAKHEIQSAKAKVLDVFAEQEETNVRTLMFVVSAYRKFYDAVGKIEFEPDSYLQEHKEAILKYTAWATIQVKRGIELPEWGQECPEIDYVYLGKGWLGQGIKGYRFVNEFLTTGYFNPQMVTDAILASMEMRKSAGREQHERGALSGNKLYHWWLLEDEDILELMDQLWGELEAGKYTLADFKQLIILMLQMQQHEIALGDKTIEDYIELMKRIIEGNPNEWNEEELAVLTDDKNFEEMYNSLVEPLFNMVHENRQAKNAVENDILASGEWTDEFVSWCKERREEYLIGRRFLFYFDVEQTLNRLGLATVCEIDALRRGIIKVYNFSNLGDFFQADLPNLEALLAGLDPDRLSGGKKTRLLALNRLKDCLSEAKKKITGQ